MEDMGILNEIHIVCLHYIFIPRINRALSHFLEAWNYHPPPSMGNLSPIQLWIAGLSRDSTDECITDVRMKSTEVQNPRRTFKAGLIMSAYPPSFQEMIFRMSQLHLVHKLQVNDSFAHVCIASICDIIKQIIMYRYYAVSAQVPYGSPG